MRPRIRLYVFQLVVLLIISPSTVNAAISLDELTLNGIMLSRSTYAEVVERLGEPKRKSSDEQGRPPLIHLAFSGIRISIAADTNKVVYIMTDAQDKETRRGVRPGATAHKVVKEYGQPAKKSLNGRIYYIYDTQSGDEHHLIFDMTEGYVSKIIFTALPLE